jgi:limonene-1,2-epoxide hydrolase
VLTTVDIERFLRAFWRSEWDTCGPMLARDALYEDPLLLAPVRGRDAILDVLRFCHAWSALEPTLRSVFGDGERFCAELRVVGTVTAPADGIPQSSVGRHFDFAEADVFQVSGDEIVRMSIYADVVSFLQQIDAAP